MEKIREKEKLLKGEVSVGIGEIFCERYLKQISTFPRGYWEDSDSNDCPS